MILSNPLSEGKGELLSVKVLLTQKIGFWSKQFSNGRILSGLWQGTKALISRFCTSRTAGIYTETQGIE